MGGNKKNKQEAKTYKSANVEFDTVNEDMSHNISENQYVDKNAVKRIHEDSESEEVPKKAKKKKKTNIEDTSGKKNKKSIRQMKREKLAQRQAEAQAQVKEQLKSQCLNYLSQWKHDRQNWKFMKAKQVWLYKNKFSTQLLPDASWQVFLEYFESAKGNIKKMLLDDANKVIKQMDEWTESHDKDEEAAPEDIKKPDETVYNRARSLIQCLQE